MALLSISRKARDGKELEGKLDSGKKEYEKEHSILNILFTLIVLIVSLKASEFEGIQANEQS